MRIIHCLAKKNSVFQNTSLHFDSPVTVLSGKTGSGKTLLARAFADTLWGAVSGKYLLSKETWDSLEIELTIELGKTQFIFYRNGFNQFTIREAATSENKILVSAFGLDTHHVQLPDTIPPDLAELLVQFSPQSFADISMMSSPFDGQSSPAADGTSFLRIFMHDISGYDSAHDNICKQGFDTPAPLLSALHEHEAAAHSVGKNMQLIELKNSKIHKLNAEKRALEIECAQLTTQIESLNAKLAVINSISSENSRIRTLENECESIRQQIRQDDETKQSLETLQKSLGTQFPQFKNFTAEQHANLDVIQNEYQNLRETCSKIDELEETDSYTRNKLFLSIVSINIIALLILIITLLINPFHFKSAHKIYMTVGCILVQCLVSAGFWTTYFMKNGKKIREELVSTRHTQEEQLLNTLKMNNILAEDFYAESIYEILLQYFEEYGMFSEKQEEIEQHLNALHSPDHMEELKARLTELSEKARALKDQVEVMVSGFDNSEWSKKIISDESVLRGEIQLEIQKIDEERTRKEEIHRHILSEIEHHSPDTSERDELKKQKASAASEIARLKQYENAIYYVKKIMEHAAGIREKKQLQLISAEVVCILDAFFPEGHTVTEGVIEQLIKTGSFDTQNTLLMQATLFAIKCSMSKILEKNNLMVPLIIDEPFLFTESSRIGAFKHTLDGFSSLRQIIIFTSQATGEDIGKQVEL